MRLGRRRPFADLVERQLELFAREHGVLLEACERALDDYRDQVGAKASARAAHSTAPARPFPPRRASGAGARAYGKVDAAPSRPAPAGGRRAARERRPGRRSMRRTWTAAMLAVGTPLPGVGGRPPSLSPSPHPPPPRARIYSTP